jgi:hypothetical protein
MPAVLRSRRGQALGVGVQLAAHCTLLAAQQPAVERERQEFARWIASAPTSPLAAVALLAVGPGVRLGPAGSDVPLAGLPEHRITERDGRLTLAGPDFARPLVRGRPTAVGRHTVLAAGPPARTTITVYTGPARTQAKRPEWYAYDSAASVEVTLKPPLKAGLVRVLGADGIEVDATEAGTVSVVLGRSPAVLSVRRMPGATPEESELEVYFRDGTNGKTTYPAGRFVALFPAGQGRYRLDFNRARNPFCAYSSVYPCPAPWRGNTIPEAVEAGERYTGGGLDPAGVLDQ